MSRGQKGWYMFHNVQDSPPPSNGKLSYPNIKSSEDIQSPSSSCIEHPLGNSECPAQVFHHYFYYAEDDGLSRYTRILGRENFLLGHRIRQICLYFIWKPRLTTWNSSQIAVFNKWIVCIWHSLKFIKHSWGRVSLYSHLTRCETPSPVKQHDTLETLDSEAAELALAVP